MSMGAPQVRIEVEGSDVVIIEFPLAPPIPKDSRSVGQTEHDETATVLVEDILIDGSASAMWC
jgi:hypothetical protein